MPEHDAHPRSVPRSVYERISSSVIIITGNGIARAEGVGRSDRTAKKRDMCETKVTGRMVGVRKDRRTRDGRCRWWQTRGGTEEDEVGGNPTPGRTEGNVRAPLPAPVPFPTTSSSLLTGCSSSRGHDPSSRRLIRGTVNPLERQRERERERERERKREREKETLLHRWSLSSTLPPSFGRTQLCPTG